MWDIGFAAAAHRAPGKGAAPPLTPSGIQIRNACVTLTPKGCGMVMTFHVVIPRRSPDSRKP